MSPQREGKALSQNKYIARAHFAHFHPLTSATFFPSIRTPNTVHFIQRAE